MSDNKYPYGKLNEDDEGELTLAIHTEGNTVRIDFGKPVAWFSMPPDEALGFAALIVEHAERIKRDMQ